MFVRRCAAIVRLAGITVALDGCGGGGSSGPPAPTPTPTATATAMPTSTAKPTATPTVSATSTPTAKPTATPTPTATPSPTPTLALAAFTLSGGEQNVIAPGSTGLQYTPDEHVSFMRQSDGTFLLWAAGGGTYGTYLFRTPDLLSLGAPTSVFQPSGAGTTAFDADYAGAGSVFPAINGTDLLMIYHAENHLFSGVDYPGTPFYAGIGLARSHDGGVTWTREGEIISGHDPQQPTQSSPGAGAATPTVVETGGFIYVIYREIDVQSKVVGFGIARAPIAGDGAPGTWLKYDAGSFGTAGLGGAFTPLAIVLDPAVPSDQRQPHVSFNAYLHQYVMAAVGNGGIYVSTSPDLIHWTNGLVALPGAYPDSTITNSEVHDWYPTIVSPSEPSEEFSAQTGYLYYAKFLGDGTSHHDMYRRAFTITGR